MSFQNGVNGYNGTQDTYLREYSPGAAFGSGTSLNADTDERSGADTQGLLRFDAIFGTGAGQIPLGATIEKAELVLQTSNAGSGASLHRMQKDWSEASTWASLSGGVAADGVEAVASADLVTGKVATGSRSFDVTKSLQAWSAGAANKGWLFKPSGTDGWDVASSEGSVKPVLKVSYTTGSTTTNPTPDVVDAINDTATTVKDKAATIAVLSNDVDQYGDDLHASEVTVTITKAPLHGTAVVNSDDTVTYKPAAGYVGDDAFQYKVANATSQDLATAAIKVTAPTTTSPTPPATGTPFSGTVLAKDETPNAAGSGDVADDPAFWVNKADASKSVVFGTNKDSAGGLYVYDLDGNILQFVSENQAYNNVDVRYGFNLGGKTVDLVGVSNTNKDTMDFFTIDPATRKLTPVGDVPTGLSIYGFAMGQSSDGKFHASHCLA